VLFLNKKFLPKIPLQNNLSGNCLSKNQAFFKHIWGLRRIVAISRKLIYFDNVYHIKRCLTDV